MGKSAREFEDIGDSSVRNVEKIKYNMYDEMRYLG